MHTECITQLLWGDTTGN